MNCAHSITTRVALFAALALALPFAPRVSAQAPTPVRVEAATMVELQQMRRVNGEIRARHRSLVAVREGGIVGEVLVREGDRVAKGQVLARLDVVRLADELLVLTAERAEADAAVTEQQAVVQRSERDLEILEDLASRDAANQKELLDARSQVAIDRAREMRLRQVAAVIEARRRQWEQRVEDMQPKAPFDGVVVARLANLGAWLGAGDAVVELVSDTDLEAVLEVPQSDYAALAVSKSPIEFEIAAGGRVTSTAWRVVPVIASSGRTFPLYAELPPSADFAPGMSLVAEVPTSTRAPHLTISRDALMRGLTGFHVFAVRPGQGEGAAPVAGIAPVEVLFFQGDRAAIRVGAVQPGDSIVVEGNERLRPGEALAPTPRAQAEESVR